MAKVIGKQKKDKEALAKLTFFEKSNLLYGGWKHMVKWSEEEAKAAWKAHREDLLEEYIGTGSRPDSFWKFDYPGVLEQFEEDGQIYGRGELQALAQIGEATPEELLMFEDGVDPYEEEAVEAWRKAKGFS